MTMKGRSSNASRSSSGGEQRPSVLIGEFIASPRDSPELPRPLGLSLVFFILIVSLFLRCSPPTLQLFSSFTSTPGVVSPCPNRLHRPHRGVSATWPIAPCSSSDCPSWHHLAWPWSPVASCTLSKSMWWAHGRISPPRRLECSDLMDFTSELIYPRNVPVDARTNVPSPRQFGVSDFEDLQIPTPDGESLHALFLRAPKSHHARNLTVLMFHGNAGNIGHRVPIAKVIHDTLHCNVFMLEYRGYGLSTGVPDEAGLKLDAQTGLSAPAPRD